MVRLSELMAAKGLFIFARKVIMDIFQENLDEIMSGKVPVQREIAKESLRKRSETDVQKAIEEGVAHEQWQIRTFV